jgi:hypothetical protein
MRNLEPGCRKFDMLDNYPWAYRTDFSKLSFADKNKLERLIDDISNILDERDTTILTIKMITALPPATNLIILLPPNYTLLSSVTTCYQDILIQ